MNKKQTLYRLEHKTDKLGLWYNQFGEYKPTGLFQEILMPKEAKFSKDNQNWFCATSSKEQFDTWFSKEDILYLVSKDFVIYEIVAENVTIEPLWALFTKENIISQEDVTSSYIASYDIWGAQPAFRVKYLRVRLNQIYRFSAEDSHL